MEQSIKTNDHLAKLLSLSSANAASAAVNYIGKTVTAAGSTTQLENGVAKWSFNLEQTAPEAVITIKNAGGVVVFSQKTAVEAGTHNFVWDGKMTNGVTVPEGAYTISVDAQNDDGQKIAVTTNVTGRVGRGRYDRQRTDLDHRRHKGQIFQTSSRFPSPHDPRLAVRGWFVSEKTARFAHKILKRPILAHIVTKFGSQICLLFSLFLRPRG